MLCREDHWGSDIGYEVRERHSLRVTWVSGFHSQVDGACC